MGDRKGAQQEVVGGLFLGRWSIRWPRFGIDFEAFTKWVDERTGGGLTKLLGSPTTRSAGTDKLKREFELYKSAPELTNSYDFLRRMGGMPGNVGDFLAGLSFLETSQTGRSAPGSSMSETWLTRHPQRGAVS